MSSKNSLNGYLFKQIVQAQSDMYSAKMKHDEYLKGRRSIISGYSPAIETIAEKEEREKLYAPYIEAKKKHEDLLGALNERDLELYEQFRKDNIKAVDVTWFFLALLSLIVIVTLAGFILPILVTAYLIPFLATIISISICLGIIEYKSSGVKKLEFKHLWGVYPASNIVIED